MISVKYSEAFICIYSDYGCDDSACPLNKLHVPTESTFGITDIKRPGCIKIMDIVFDKHLDDSIRNWIKAAHVEGKVENCPPAFGYIRDRIKPKITPPLVRWMRGANVAVGPGVMIPYNRKQPIIKNLIWHIREKCLCFIYAVRIPWLVHWLWVQWLWHIKFRSERYFNLPRLCAGRKQTALLAVRLKILLAIMGVL